jgi:hypothetical protein
MLKLNIFFFKRGILGFFLFMYVIQSCFICGPSDSTVSEDAGIEPRTVATFALTARCATNFARSHPQSRSTSTKLHDVLKNLNDYRRNQVGVFLL